MLTVDNKQLRPLILDIGNCNFRLGWAGSDFPEIIVPSVYVDATDNIFESDVIDGLEDLFFGKNTERHLYGIEASCFFKILTFLIYCFYLKVKQFCKHYKKKLELSLIWEISILISPQFFMDLLT